MGINSNVFPHTAHGKFILKRVKFFFSPVAFYIFYADL